MTTIAFSKRSRVALLLAAALVASLLSWFSIRAALAAHYAELGTSDGYRKAVRLEPENPQYWYLLGRDSQFRESSDIPTAIHSYQKALRLDPYLTDAWLDLGAALEAENDIDGARAAFVQAKAVYPDSAEVAWRYGNFLLRQGNLTAGSKEVHHAVELDPKRGLEAFLLMRHYKDNVKLIVDQDLAPVPSMLEDVAWELTQEGKADDFLTVWSRIVSLHPRLQERELRYYVDGLLHLRRFAEAQKVWAEGVALMDLPGLQDPPGSLIWDGGFETDLSNGGFAWRIQKYQPIMVGLDRQIKHSGTRSLRLDFSKEFGSEFVGVCHDAVVDPITTYEFSAWMRTRNLSQDGGLFFQLLRLAPNRAQVASTLALGASNDWTHVTTSFTSSEDLRLLVVCLARTPDATPNGAGSTAWIDDVSLVKISSTRTQGRGP